MVPVPGERGWVSSLPKGARLLGSPSDTCASQVAETPPEGARWDRPPQREWEIH